MLNEYAPWFAIAVATASLLYTIVSNNRKGHDQKFTDFQKSLGVVETQVAMSKRETDQRVDAVEDRVTTIETEMRHMPDKDMTHRLEVSISELRGEMRMLTERIKPIAAISDRIQDAVLDKVTHT